MGPCKWPAYGRDREEKEIKEGVPRAPEKVKTKLVATSFVNFFNDNIIILIFKSNFTL